MGKIKKKLFDKNFDGSSFQIELNKEPSEKSKKVIHLSYKKVRIELTKKEFFEISSSILLAERNLKILKKIKY